MLSYPPAPTADVTEVYFGTPVADPYRPLEDIDAPETRKWLAEQRAVTEAYFSALPDRAAIRARLGEIADFERTGFPSHENQTYVVERNSGLQNQSVVYTMYGENGEQRVLLDPNTLSENGTVAVAGGSLSFDGKYYAYALQRSGSDWQTWYVRDVATGEDLTDRVEWAKFSGASWNADGSGFYYSRYDEPADPAKLDIVSAYQKIYFHRLGTPQAQDVLVYERPDEPKMYLFGHVTEDGRYLVIVETRGGVKNGLVVRDLHAPHGPDVRLTVPDLARYAVVDNQGERFFIYTTQGAPNARLVAIDLRDPHAMHELIPEGPEASRASPVAAGASSRRTSKTRTRA